MKNSRYERVYKQLYQQHRTNEAQMTTGELIQTLKILTPKVDVTGILLIGTHNEQPGHETIFELPPEDVARLAEEIRNNIQEKTSDQAGYYQNIVSLLIEALRTHLSIRRDLLLKFATKRKFDRFIELFQNRRIVTTPLPLYPSKRDLVLLAAGAYPGYFHNRLSHPQKNHRGLAVYLDVSGSVNQYLPRILGILKNLRKEITTIFQFSNRVVETRFSELLKGNIRTTYGTDFDCIARSIIEQGFDKAIIITDGYASMTDELSQRLKQQKLNTLTILFDKLNGCESFEPFGEVVKLEDVVN
ncbi:MAG: hypothetical protein ABIL68_03760, partial [bacterium]